MEGKTDSPIDRIVRLKEICELVGLTDSTVWLLVQRGKFPQPFRIVPGGRAVGWRQSAVESWIDQREHAGTQPSAEPLLRVGERRAATDGRGQ
jgi:prophage regulatory protein